MRSADQLKARLRALARETGLEVEVVLREYMMECLLERIAGSGYRDRFALKGGMLVVALVGMRARVTMDMDVSFSGEPLTEENLLKIFEKVVAVPTARGGDCSILGVTEIRGGGDYPGFRVALSAVCGNMRQTLHIDVAAGDAVTPGPGEIGIKSLFGDPPIRIRAYNVETILAEKLETTLSRGVANSRMRDFYDMFILVRQLSFDPTLFRQAVLNTAMRRGTEDRLGDGRRTLDEVASSVAMQEYWRRYAAKNKFASDLQWVAVVDVVRELARIACGDSTPFFRDD